jgi:DNA-binding NarL/FixJ family response regulator
VHGNGKLPAERLSRKRHMLRKLELHAADHYFACADADHVHRFHAHAWNVVLRRDVFNQWIGERQDNSFGDSSAGITIRTGCDAEMIDGAPLSAKEQAILEAIAEGLQDKQMQDRIQLSKSGLRWNLKKLFKRFGIPGGAGGRILLVVYGFRNGLLK